MSVELKAGVPKLFQLKVKNKSFSASWEDKLTKIHHKLPQRYNKIC